jgi:hypothetical protein
MRVPLLLLVAALAGCAEAPEEELPDDVGGGGCTGGSDGIWRPVMVGGESWSEQTFAVSKTITYLTYRVSWSQFAGDDGRVQVVDADGTAHMDKTLGGSSDQSMGGWAEGPATGTGAVRLQVPTGANQELWLHVGLYTGDMREGCG